jgi:PPOX class probable F420-dependent enzyme
MISEDSRIERFLSEQRWAVLTTLRRNGGPVSSVVAFARDGDSLLVSTPGGTFKRRSIEQDPRVSLCVISSSEPFSFVGVEGRARIETGGLLEGTRKIFANIAVTGYPEPDNLPQWLDDQARVLIRIQPERTYAVLR